MQRARKRKHFRDPSTGKSDARVGCRVDGHKKEIEMTSKLASFTVLIFALTMSLAAFAGSKSQSVRLFNDAQINGKTIPAGEYQVSCDTKGSNAQVKFSRNGKEVATANGQVKQLTTAPDHTQVITQDSGSSRTISEIDFGHSSTGVTFDSGAMSSAGTN